ncbi:MAG TPA: class I SAM-dependent methyltransferase [Allosphingosinicella sp.]|nr:class I SAM-dependent methyltransferase [Allosphingosinicella sp.]
MSNVDRATVRAFDDKWAATYRGPGNPERARQTFEAYFALFPFDELKDGEGFELGCGTGRHAVLVAPRVGRLHCIDPAPSGLAATRRRLAGQPNVEFHLAGVDDIPLEDGSQDFGYSLGVLHHIPDTEAALASCTAKLKPGAPFLLYLYYDFENRPLWYRAIWKLSDWGRRLMCKLPFRLRKAATDVIAVTVYWPFARAAGAAAKAGLPVEWIPLSSYRNAYLVNMRFAALDRFGTGVERRFSRAAIRAMMERCGLTGVRIADGPPYWVAIGRKRAAG